MSNFNENVILYQEDDDRNITQQFDDHYINDKEIKIKGGLNNLSLNSITSKIKSIFASIKNFFVKKSKRTFIKMHQFFGCSHLMSVRYFLSSINNCTFVSTHCRTKDDFFILNGTKCHSLSMDEFGAPPRMGYFADLSEAKFKKSFGNFFLNTSGKEPFCRTTPGKQLTKSSIRHSMMNKLKFNFFD